VTQRSQPVAEAGLNSPQPIGGPIPLNAEQKQAAKEWAADDRLWTTQETVEFNLRTFARVILKHREDRAVTAPPVPPPADARWFPDPPPGPSRAVTAPQEPEQNGKCPQPTDVLVTRLRRVAKWLESEVDPDDADPDDEAKAAMRARANTCWQCTPSPTQSRPCEGRWRIGKLAAWVGKRLWRLTGGPRSSRSGRADMRNRFL
jgi:hypothetical protein